MADTCVASAGTNLPAPVDTGFMRVYDTSVIANLPGTSPAYQVLDGPVMPRLLRGTVVGFVVAQHFDGLTHGHRPGLNIGNPAATTCGDWADRLSGALADAERR
jgi:hypothetical protein